MGHLGVLIFFILSGFLIARSWDNKKNFLDFSFARVLRIYSATMVVVLLSVFLLGPFCSSLSLEDYFKDSTP
jgi:peptidoglycan/LPS O-acetylase OafA/YrhL